MRTAGQGAILARPVLPELGTPCASLYRKVQSIFSGLLSTFIGHTMAIKIVVSNTVGFRVKGAINDEKGVSQPFHFDLTCVRLNSEQIQAKLKSDSELSIIEFLVDVVEGWSGVRDAEDKVVPYSEASLRELCLIAGTARLAFNTYLGEVGAKEKN